MKNYLLLSLFLLCTSTLLFAQEDSLETKLLNEVTVIGYDANRKLLQTPGAVALITSQQIRAFDEISALPSMNLIPGVRMEERSPGSYRIAVRGSTLRAPFGVRNIKVYWNNIPFTEPSGSTNFNLLDISNLGKIEVIKGPAGSIYGAGTGGVVNIQSASPRLQEDYIGAEAMIGSYGLKRYATTVNEVTENATYTFKYAHQQSDGYRNHTEFDRDVIELHAKFQASEKREISASFLYSDLFYEIPGGLNEEQYNENPRQARPSNPFALGSEESEAGIDQEYVLFGLSQDYQWNDKLSNLTTIYGDFSFFENPFNLDYKRDSRMAGGGRTRFDYQSHLFGLDTRFTLGGEFQTGTNVARNFANDYGKPGALNFDDELKSYQSIVFGRAELELPHDFFLTLGLSRNSLEYDINRLVDNNLDSAYQVEKTFDPVWVPRVGLAKQFNRIAAHASISYGFSPPTIEDVRTNEGSINLGLKPEKGINYELGLRGNTLNGKLNFDVSAFYFQLDETIVQQQSERGTVLFTNTGSTDQKGLETAFTYFALQENAGFIKDLDFQLSYTLHDFTFNNYTKFVGDELQDYSGNELTGVARNIAVFATTLQTNVGVYLNGSINFTDEIPLDDANSVYSEAYELVLLKLGYRAPLSDKLELEIFGGVNNLLDQKYSLGNDLNAFGGRYYQPAPDRNYYAGLKVHLNY
ncbi:TonB-dependent receptor plug domain-containing protein [Porifericola rhodea]|uniref:TonB-dependent receptor family protein n=1 Tax=Porifericola rhodea TaxID=930972 RepID=UPI0026658D7C|nr:TonB-dependent receptor plug domain-containing protein [Porifericola rhodea]WKN31655.1 TonB-dependent receptor plug domain-containing protein [Porifericola rhodea]